MPISLGSKEGLLLYAVNETLVKPVVPQQLVARKAYAIHKNGSHSEKNKLMAIMNKYVWSPLINRIASDTCLTSQRVHDANTRR